MKIQSSNMRAVLMKNHSRHTHAAGLWTNSLAEPAETPLLITHARNEMHEARGLTILPRPVYSWRQSTTSILASAFLFPGRKGTRHYAEVQCVPFAWTLLPPGDWMDPVGETAPLLVVGHGVHEEAVALPASPMHKRSFENAQQVATLMLVTTVWSFSFEIIYPFINQVRFRVDPLI